MEDESSGKADRMNESSESWSGRTIYGKRHRCFFLTVEALFNVVVTGSFLLYRYPRGLSIQSSSLGQLFCQNSYPGLDIPTGQFYRSDDISKAVVLTSEARCMPSNSLHCFCSSSFHEPCMQYHFSNTSQCSFKITSERISI
jgi:hypothetical protein